MDAGSRGTVEGTESVEGHGYRDQNVTTRQISERIAATWAATRNRSRHFGSWLAGCVGGVLSSSMHPVTTKTQGSSSRQSFWLHLSILAHEKSLLLLPKKSVKCQLRDTW